MVVQTCNYYSAPMPGKEFGKYNKGNKLYVGINIQS